MTPEQIEHVRAEVDRIAQPMTFLALALLMTHPRPRREDGAYEELVGRT